MFRKAGDSSDREFWAHLLALATEMIPAKPKKGSHFRNALQVQHNADPGEAQRSWTSGRTCAITCAGRMRYHPVEKVRLKAALKFADMLYPQLADAAVRAGVSLTTLRRLAKVELHRSSKRPRANFPPFYRLTHGKLRHLHLRKRCCCSRGKRKGSGKTFRAVTVRLKTCHTNTNRVLVCREL